jgi:hypothetical protein
MLLHRHSHEEDEPCRHMRLLISGESDGTLAGILGWYTRQHLKGCSRCRRGLQNLITLREKLRALGSPEIRESDAAGQVPPLTPERRALIEAEWSRIDEQTG